MRRDYPQRQGPQGLGVGQSQSAVGQKWIQYSPPPPSVGQRSQYQSQGAARAPPVTQTGRRGQVIDRGKGRGPQARMLGIQGRVYAVTSSAESADQPVLQGTFMLSRL